MIGATQNIVPNAVSSGRYPPEGARSVKVTVDFSQGSSQIIDLVMMLQRLGMSCIQAAFINNANGANSITIRAAATGQEQTISAGAQGWINFLSPDFDTLTVTSGGTDTVDFHLLNFPVTPHIWGASGSVPPGLYVLVAGDTMTGPLILDADPTDPLGAATKQYVDGIGAGFVQIAGDTMTGPLQVPAGTVAAPGLDVGEVGTGLYRPAAGQLGLAVGGVEGLYIDSGNISAYRSAGLINTWSSDSALTIAYERYSGNSFAASYQIRKARGTRAAPTVVATNDILGSFLFQGYNSAAFVTVNSIINRCVAAAPGVGAMEGRIEFSLSPAAGAAAEMMRLQYAVGLSMYGANVIVDNNRLLKLRVYTVATLPAAAVAGAGATAYVSNAAAPAWGVAVVGGGAVGCPVYTDGAIWYAG